MKARPPIDTPPIENTPPSNTPGEGVGGLRAPVWTDTPPSVPGLYWYRDNEHGMLQGALVCKEKQVLYVELTGWEVSWCADLTTAQWAGPLLEPVEPRA